jgi:hypothetical protein
MPPPVNLPTPDFSFDPSAPGACIAGVRPYRNGAYRLEGLPISNKFFVHNCGHDGAGITIELGLCNMRSWLTLRRRSTPRLPARKLSTGPR